MNLLSVIWIELRTKYLALTSALCSQAIIYLVCLSIRSHLKEASSA